MESKVQTITASMGEAIVFTSIADAMSKGRLSCKGSFNAESGEEGNEDTKSYVVIFNAKWNSLAKALNNRMAAFFAAIYTVGNMTDEELKIEPGLSNTQEVVRCWRDILTELHPQFVNETSAFKVSMFSNPPLELELSAALRKK